MSILIEKSHLRERLIVQAAQMFVKMKNRHDENDTGLLDEERFAGRGEREGTAGKGFGGKGLSSLLGASASSKLSKNGTTGGGSASISFQQLQYSKSSNFAQL